MSLQCPRCQSPKIASFHRAMKVTAAVGCAGGVARGVSTALAGGQAGAALGVIAGHHARIYLRRHPWRFGRWGKWMRAWCRIG